MFRTIRSYQVLENEDAVANPSHTEGKSNFKLIAVAKCATNDGPVDAREVPGLEKNYDTVKEFLDACQECGYLAKESETEVVDPTAKKPEGGSKSRKKSSKK